MKNLILALTLITSTLTAHAQGKHFPEDKYSNTPKRVTLYAGDEPIDIYGTEVSCLPRKKGSSSVCMISYANYAYHAYSVQPDGETTVINYDGDLNRIIKDVVAAREIGQCNSYNTAIPKCSVVLANNKHHVYMEVPAKKTVVYWYDSFSEAVDLVKSLKSQHLCR